MGCGASSTSQHDVDKPLSDSIRDVEEKSSELPRLDAVMSPPSSTSITSGSPTRRSPLLRGGAVRVKLQSKQFTSVIPSSEEASIDPFKPVKLFNYNADVMSQQHQKEIHLPSPQGSGTVAMGHSTQAGDPPLASFVDADAFAAHDGGGAVHPQHMSATVAYVSAARYPRTKSESVSVSTTNVSGEEPAAEEERYVPVPDLI